jgi:2-haloacid dehalogenase
MFMALYLMCTLLSARMPRRLEDFQAFSDLWRSKQLEYSWVRTLMGAYGDFWQLTQESLEYAFAKFPGVDRCLREPLLEAYLRLDCHENVPETLRRLKQSGVKIAVLSNGSPAMLETAIAASGLDGVLDELFSVDAVHHFKTHPLTYAMATELLNLIPRFSDQNSQAQARRPSDMIRHGWATSLFQASQQWSTISS